jgi:hypothetical protein
VFNIELNDDYMNPDTWEFQRSEKPTMTKNPKKIQGLKKFNLTDLQEGVDYISWAEQPVTPERAYKFVPYKFNERKKRK